MHEVLIKNEGVASRGKHDAICGDEVVAQIEGHTQSPLFRLAKMMYAVEFKDDQSIEFRQSGQGFTIDHIIYDIYRAEKQIGKVKRKSLKVSYEVAIEDGEFAIEHGWLTRGNIKYTNLQGDEITIETGRTGLANWKINSASELSQIDMAIVLFMRAMSELMLR